MNKQTRLPFDVRTGGLWNRCRRCGRRLRGRLAQRRGYGAVCFRKRDQIR